MLSDALPVLSLHTALSPLKCSLTRSSPPPDFLQKPMSVQPQEAEARSEGVDGLPAPEKLPTSGCQISILNPTKSPPVPAVSETSTHHSVVGENDVPSPAKLRKMSEGFMNNSDFRGGVSGDEKSDEALWPLRVETIFINLMAELAKKHPNQSSNLKDKQWEQVENDMLAITGTWFKRAQLKSKRSRLRAKYREFTKLRNHTGFGWDHATQTCTASDDVWDNYLMANKGASQFREKGCANYDNLVLIFAESTATGRLARSSMQRPLTSAEEREKYNEYVGGSSKRGVAIDIDDDILDSSMGTKRKSDGTPVSARSGKESKSVKMDIALDAWTECSKAKAQKYQLEVTSKVQREHNVDDVYSINRCLQILGQIPDVPGEQFVAAMNAFKDKDFRVMFVEIPDFRRLQWLASLAP